jgi:hypothetical protein
VRIGLTFVCEVTAGTDHDAFDTAEDAIAAAVTDAACPIDIDDDGREQIHATPGGIDTEALTEESVESTPARPDPRDPPHPQRCQPPPRQATARHSLPARIHPIEGVASAMSEHRFSVDDRVVVAPEFARPAHRGVVYRVTRLLPVNVVVEPERGGRAMRINPTYLQPAPDQPASDATAPSTGIGAVGVPYVPQPLPLDQGTVVTVAGPGWKQPPEQLYVVLRDSGDGCASIVKLGGERGRYWRGVRRALMTVIDPARITLADDAPTAD